MARMFTISVTFLDGVVVAYEGPTAPDMHLKRMKVIEDLIHSNALVLEADGALIVHPLANIRSIEVAPIEQEMPAAFPLKGFTRVK